MARAVCVCFAITAGGLVAIWMPALLHWLGPTPEGAYWARVEVKNLHKALKCAVCRLFVVLCSESMSRQVVACGLPPCTCQQHFSDAGPNQVAYVCRAGFTPGRAATK